MQPSHKYVTNRQPSFPNATTALNSGEASQS